MGKPIKTNVRGFNKKNIVSENVFLLKQLKKQYPTAIDIEVFYLKDKPKYVEFKMEVGGVVNVINIR